MEQWCLRDFFKPGRAWLDLKLLQYRTVITNERSSLPRQAGRALEKFWSVSADLVVKRVRAAKVPAGSQRRVRQQDRSITVKAVARPEIDVEKLARAFIYTAQGVAKKRAVEQDPNDQDLARP